MISNKQKSDDDIFQESISIKIFRQSTLGDWKKPIEELICELKS